jgi:hypothetical protein
VDSVHQWTDLFVASAGRAAARGDKALAPSMILSMHSIQHRGHEQSGHRRTRQEFARAAEKRPGPYVDVRHASRGERGGSVTEGYFPAFHI